jgi:transposase
LLEDIRCWLDEYLPIVPPRSPLGKAMNHAHKQWSKLTVYVADGRLRIDNNLTENAIRPFVIGRTIFLFCDTVAGASASANLYSLIETAKAHGIEPYAYLRTVFTELLQATSVEEIEALLPAPNDSEDSAQVSWTQRRGWKTCL